MGVFATRSPFRPNPIGLSSVVLEQIQWQSPQGPILHIRGADLMDGTPIYDIKPYLPYCDCHPQAKGGFTDAVPRTLLQVDFPPALLQQVEPAQQQAMLGVLAQDPRPSYQSDPQRVYGLAFGPWNVRFSVNGQQLSVLALERRRAPGQEEG